MVFNTAYKQCSVRLYLQLFVGGLHVLVTSFVFVYVKCCPTHSVLCFCFVFLRLVYLMLPVSLCFSSSCVPYLASFSVFFFVLCTLSCQFLCVFLRVVYLMLPVSLDCTFLIVPYVFSSVYSSNISVISWRSVLLGEKTGIPGENHRPATVTDTRQTLAHNVESSKHTIHFKIYYYAKHMAW